MSQHLWRRRDLLATAAGAALSQVLHGLRPQPMEHLAQGSSSGSGEQITAAPQVLAHGAMPRLLSLWRGNQRWA